MKLEVAKCGVGRGVKIIVLLENGSALRSCKLQCIVSLERWREQTKMEFVVMRLEVS